MPKTRKPAPLADSIFTATQWSTGEEKWRAAQAVIRFLEADCAAAQWTPAVYHTLSQHLFAHIAHYDRHGFYATWFSNWRQRLDWIEHALNHPRYGDPARTWSDVESALQAWLRESELPERWEAKANEERRLVLAQTAFAALGQLDGTDRQAVLAALEGRDGVGSQP